MTRRTSSVLRPVNTLHPAELDVRGGRGAGDERDRAGGIGGGGAEPGNGLGDEADHLVFTDDAEVVVGQE